MNNTFGDIWSQISHYLIIINKLTPHGIPKIQKDSPKLMPTRHTFDIRIYKIVLPTKYLFDK